MARPTKRVEGWLGSLVSSLRAAMAERGWSASDLDRRMSWPEGRSERILSKPEEIELSEFLELTRQLDLSPDRCFDPATS